MLAFDERAWGVDMKVICTASGSVTWKNTRDTVVKSATFRTGSRDFGAGVENVAECPNCKRVLPTVCMHLDHIRPRSVYTVKMFQTAKTFEIYSDNGAQRIVKSPQYRGFIHGGVAYSMKMAMHRPTKRQHKLSGGDTKFVNMGTGRTISPATVWENDLNNLQFLCMSCNTSKSAGGLTFVAEPLGAKF